MCRIRLRNKEKKKNKAQPNDPRGVPKRSSGRGGDTQKVGENAIRVLLGPKNGKRRTRKSRIQ